MKFKHFVLSVTTLLLMSCSNNTTTSLTVYGSNSATASIIKNSPMSLLTLDARAAGLSGSNVSYVNFDFYAFYISTNTDCSNPVLVADNGTTSVAKNMAAAGTTLFTGSPAAGTYKCIAIKMSDVITFRPDSFSAAASGSQCSTTTDYTFDIYRTNSGDTWKDINGATITATGNGVTMGPDKVFIFASTDSTALAAGAIAPHRNQTVALNSSLTVPGSSTFYSSFLNQVSITPECGLEGVSFGFR